LTDNKAATTFVKQVLHNGPHMGKLHRWQTFLSQFNAVYEHISRNNNFLVDYLYKRQAILIITTPDKIKELENIIVDFNEYLETVSTRLEHLNT